ncbi:phenylacetate--CoA ligase family protein [Desulfatitalea alkaliphila]|uniref:Phenylacetate-CoA ligase n=1 Tax=Desulfatitalea alkaliphila TaxID=2929485 RepID=A0AA41UMX7_9BACT|nr:hypothetical protein [Desulfatitalea alkaliphila]MCJ8503131.1 hypothetical protein [Desulfatitalea alkaliphila]
MKAKIRRALLKLRGSKRYDYFDEYERLQWQPIMENEKYQFFRLKQLLNHAYETVPYYRDIFRSLDMRPDDIRTKADISRLPVLTKNIIKTNKSGLTSKAFKADELITLSSGGSTGEPLKFFTHHNFFEEHNATFMLSLKIAGWKENERLISIWGNPNDGRIKPGLKTFLKNVLSANLHLNAYKYDSSTIRDWIEHIQAKNNTFIYGYTSVVQNVAEHIIDKNIHISNVKGVMTSAEKLHDWQRILIQKAFNCKVYDQYGSREVPGIASECPAGNMHQFLHSAYVEYLPVLDHPENRCKLIVTSLINKAMPFIRYEIGDYAVPGSRICPCGRGYPLMEMKIGRIADRFITSKGKTIYGTFFVRQMYDIEGVKNFQFHQLDTHSIRLNMIKSHNFSEIDIHKISQIESNIKQALGWDDLSLDVQYVDEIPKTIGGKHRHIISDVTG